MKLQVLISTMNQTDHSLLEKMNIQSDAVVVNQCGKSSYEEFTYNGHRIKWISMCQKGVGNSRNTALSYADADIVLFSDDDMHYYDGSAETVLETFRQKAQADVFCFNLRLTNDRGEELGGNNCQKPRKLHLHNMLRYGAPAIAARRKALLKNRIAFSQLFGGGAPFSSGEDTLFLVDCRKNGLKMYADPYVLADVDQSTSTWFCGYTEKFFIDKGRIYPGICPRAYPLLFGYYALRLSRNTPEYSVWQILRLFREGKKQMRNYR